jgi:hypothetical protein
MYPESGNGSARTVDVIEANASKLFFLWGGMRRVKQLFPPRAKVK